VANYLYSGWSGMLPNHGLQILADFVFRVLSVIDPIVDFAVPRFKKDFFRRTGSTDAAGFVPQGCLILKIVLPVVCATHSVSSATATKSMSEFGMSFRLHEMVTFVDYEFQQSCGVRFSTV
jgi:hypothetical protein